MNYTNEVSELQQNYQLFCFSPFTTYALRFTPYRLALNVIEYRIVSWLTFLRKIYSIDYTIIVQE